MAVVRKIGILSNTLLRNNVPLIQITRGNKDFQTFLDFWKPVGMRPHMPDDYPETEEERRKSAAKYGLHPYEYEPYPNDHRYLGDYPQLPWIGVVARDPYYPWDYPVIRRNYGDPIHPEQDMMGEDRYDYGVRQLVSDTTGALIFIATIGVFYLAYKFSSHTSFPRMEKQYPRNGVHYSFEPAK
ncbi:NADH:ubiquinone oxidoreductase subunit ASHI [Megachile rotundata]|uniref:NADH:ubiquinone oxidoreductase subunit ASHI n=1 Tax=Megachile rotundata TaxID=143995 RepID=UPI000258E28B|nr:PREDICTED: NADH dehydrogenase [ubiquinone] 1 beta subcomplex subunit 8, mitochondrial [Megachile rotundata]